MACFLIVAYNNILVKCFASFVVIQRLLSVDEILISKVYLYRMAYSLLYIIFYSFNQLKVIPVVTKKSIFVIRFLENWEVCHRYHITLFEPYEAVNVESEFI